MKRTQLVAGALGVTAFAVLAIANLTHTQNLETFDKVKLHNTGNELRLELKKSQDLQRKLDDTSVKSQEEIKKLQQEIEESKKREEELQKQVSLKQQRVAEQNRLAQAAQSAQRTATATATASAAVGGSHADWMAAAGIAPSDYQAVEYIISHESGWRHTVWNGTGSGAYGLCQSLPASKMASAGSDYMTNPVTQLRWCDGYAKQRYGGWWGAYNFWVKNKWW